MESLKVFILTGEWMDLRGRNIIRLIGKSSESIPVEIIISKNNPVFFIECVTPSFSLQAPFKRKPVKLKNFNGRAVDAVYFNSQRDLLISSKELEEKNIITFESDVDPVRRYLMERFVNAQIKVTGDLIQNDNMIRFNNPEIEPCEINPDFVVASIDIETGIKNTKLYSIAIHLTAKNKNEKLIFIVGKQLRGAPSYFHWFESEKDLLITFIKWIKEADPDIIIGWHVIGFDLMFLEDKCKEYYIPFEIARTNGRVFLRYRKSGGYFASITGRVVIDGPPALRSSFFNFEDFKLETVAQELLSEGKIIASDKNKVKEIERLYKEDKITLGEYNLQDAILVTDIFKRASLIELSIRRSQLSGLLMDQLGMMTHAFDHFFLPRLHREGYVAPNIKDIQETKHTAGGYVIEPKPGIYDAVIVLDFKSLYPSIIRTFKIDPLSKLMNNVEPVETPNGYKFSFTKHILPEFIEQLMEQRALAKNKNDKQLAQAIKILMNSFYGVMGSYGCRFYHSDLTNAITRTGQFLLLESKKYLEKKNYYVIYGDTDSLFVKLKPDDGNIASEKGRNIAEELNDYWQTRLSGEFHVFSYLEIEYEKFYRKFIITPTRGSEAGAKKRYAGLLVNNGTEQLEFVGMEFVRSDWTRLAKEFQVELYKRIFGNMEIDNWLRDFVRKVNCGGFDDKLIYRKRLRKNIEDYKKNIPQHVKAAKLLNQNDGIVYYVITKRGPVPVELKHNDIDYQHYIDKQIKPVADSVLVLLDKSFDAIVNTSQLSFF